MLTFIKNTFIILVACSYANMTIQDQYKELPTINQKINPFITNTSV